MNNNTVTASVEKEAAQDLINKFIDEETVNEFQALAAELGLSEEQTQGVWNWLVQGAMRFVEDLNQDAADYCSETEEYLRGIYGNGLEARKKAANDLILKYGGDELAAFLKKKRNRKLPRNLVFPDEFGGCRKRRQRLGRRKGFRSFFGRKNQS